MSTKSDKIQFYLEEDLRVALEEYIIDNELDKKKINISRLVKSIVLEWLDNPVLDYRYIFYKYTCDIRIKRKIATICIPEEKIIDLNRIFVRKYIRKIYTSNMLVVNIIEQWARINIDGYRENEPIEILSNATKCNE